MHILITKRTPAAPWRCRNACVVHAGLASLGVAPGARAMQLRWLTSDRTWRFWWLRSRANPKPRKCDMASAWGERHRRRAPDFTSQSAGFRTQTTRECRRRRAFSTPLPKSTTTNGAAAGRRFSRPADAEVHAGRSTEQTWPPFGRSRLLRRLLLGQLDVCRTRHKCTRRMML